MEQIAIDNRAIQQLKETMERLGVNTGHLESCQELDTETNYNCPICKDKNFIFSVSENGYESCSPCKCLQREWSLKRLERSGLLSLAEKCTFESYRVTTPLQKMIKSTAQKFINQDETKIFFIGGQVGSGKTHICTAMTVELINRGVNAKYMRYMDVITEIKGLALEEGEQRRVIEGLTTPTVLYIDDLMKTRNGDNSGITDADIRHTFRILDYRYSQKLKTIISSEKTIEELLIIDQGIGSRIYEHSKGYNIEVPRKIESNYRIYGS